MFLVKGYRRLPVPAARSSAVDIVFVFVFVFVFVGWDSSLELYKKILLSGYGLLYSILNKRKLSVMRKFERKLTRQIKEKEILQKNVA